MRRRRVVRRTSSLLALLGAGFVYPAPSSGGEDRFAGLREGQLAVRCVDADRVPIGEVAFEQTQRERVLEPALDRALQRARAIRRIPACLGERFLRGTGQLERDVTLGQPFAEALELQLDDLAD